MKNNDIVISENKRAFWQLPIAALIFTAALFILGKDLYYFQWTNDYFKYLAGKIEVFAFLIVTGAGFCSRKRIYIDIENSKFKPTVEVGPFKFGKWKTINNYEYVSLFRQLLGDGNYIFEVNLWYDKNKHFELYSENHFEEALAIAFDLSEELNIDLLDATIPNDYKWIDKEALKQKHNKP